MSNLENLIKNSGFDSCDESDGFQNSVAMKAQIIVDCASVLGMTVSDLEASMWELRLAIDDAMEIAKSKAKI